ncbi:hypothetical protein [Acidianus hospitalis]|uniref:hypothetical protein n=1 Tax=Acidianus hospitalis TaxID=563177 RepID=UPI0006937DF2|nr:hypothetical protein [Acidianus hospitalis]
MRGTSLERGGNQMFPEGIKVVAISINDRPVEEHYKLGEVIAKVVNKRAIIIGTGSPTHRLDFQGSP